MPELPEVETVRRALAPAIGWGVTELWTSGLPLRLGRPLDVTALRQAAVGSTIEGVRRLGKYLLIDFIDRSESALIHLGMSGRLRLLPSDSAMANHTHLRFSLLRAGQALDLRFSDPRRFGQADVVRRGSERDHPALMHLGIEPLSGELTGGYLHEHALRTRRSIKQLLLDQRVVAGIGNIYASEALWQAQIRPTLASHLLSRPRAERLAEAVVAVLLRALDHGGTSLRDFVSADGRSGEHGHYLWVYDRAGDRCMRRGCSGSIRRTVQQGRATFHCPHCQRR